MSIEIQNQLHQHFGERCPFCDIFSRRTEGVILSESSHAGVIQSLEGNPLVLPKRHIQLADLNDTEAKQIGIYQARLISIVKQAFKADGVNIFGTYGEAAGQEVEHGHIHVIPRVAGDKLIRISGEYNAKSLQERLIKAELLRAASNGLLR